MKNFDLGKNITEVKNFDLGKNITEVKNFDEMRNINNMGHSDNMGPSLEVTMQLHRLSVRELENLAGALCDFNEPSEKFNKLIDLCLGERQNRLKPKFAYAKRKQRDCA